MDGTGEVVRIRLLFEDKYILNKTQISEGLKQCWMIVKPYFKTVDQVASDISFTFHLHRSCPHGLLLSMEGYTLPSTQPTCILKDKDIVVVNKKRDTSEERILISEEASPKDSPTLGGRVQGHGGVKLLAINEFVEEAGGYQSESEDNGTKSKNDADMIRMGKHSIQKEMSKKKRKQSELVQHSKTKKIGPKKHGNSLQVVEVGDDERIHKKHKKISHSEDITCNAVKGHSHTKALEVELENTKGVSGLQLQEKMSRKKLKEKKTHCVKVNKESNEFPQTDHITEKCLEREDDQVEGISTARENPPRPTEVGEKSPSRSSKRKKAKRRWLREQKAKNQELVQSNGLVDEKLQLKSHNPQKLNQDDAIEAEEESLPVVVRPGHIRFLPVDEEYESQEIQDPMPVLQWNGITNKRQGQNWGKERDISVNRVKESACSRKEDYISSDDMMENILNNCPLDFDKLPSMSGLPQQGDVIAYRLVELSVTSWCPELSSFRVGKIASYDSHSSKIKLVPVPQYPFVLKNSLTEEYAEEMDASLYNEDASLEVDFGSLVDVRWIYQKNGTIDMNTDMPDVKVAGEVAMCTNGRNYNTSADMNTSFPVTKEPVSTINANGDGGNMSVWDEINQAFSSKKAELSLKEDQLEPVNMYSKPTKISKNSRSKTTKGKPCVSSKQGNGTSSSRMFKSLRGSALGPTICLLRAQNVLK